MKTQRTKDKGFGTGGTGKGDYVMKDAGRQESGAEPRTYMNLKTRRSSRAKVRRYE